MRSEHTEGTYRAGHARDAKDAQPLCPCVAAQAVESSSARRATSLVPSILPYILAQGQGVRNILWFTGTRRVPIRRSGAGLVVRVVRALDGACPLREGRHKGEISLSRRFQGTAVPCDPSDPPPVRPPSLRTAIRPLAMTADSRL